jgi:hypothetical protein
MSDVTRKIGTRIVPVDARLTWAGFGMRLRVVRGVLYEAGSAIMKRVRGEESRFARELPIRLARDCLMISWAYEKAIIL